VKLAIISARASKFCPHGWHTIDMARDDSMKGSGNYKLAPCDMVYYCFNRTLNVNDPHIRKVVPFRSQTKAIRKMCNHANAPSLSNVRLIETRQKRSRITVDLRAGNPAFKTACSAEGTSYCEKIGSPRNNVIAMKNPRTPNCAAAPGVGKYATRNKELFARVLGPYEDRIFARQLAYKPRSQGIAKIRAARNSAPEDPNLSLRIRMLQRLLGRSPESHRSAPVWLCPVHPSSRTSDRTARLPFVYQRQPT
jgi:hypothetical protein